MEPEKTVPELRCSFCDKPQSEVIKLISGQSGIAICNECVDLCNDIIAEECNEAITEEYAARAEKAEQGDPKFFCSFCGSGLSPIEKSEWVAANRRASICDRCILRRFLAIEYFEGPWKRRLLTGYTHNPFRRESRLLRFAVVALGTFGLLACLSLSLYWITNWIL